MFWVGVVLMFCGPLNAAAADLNIQSDTLLRGFERDTASETDAMVMPVYEYLQFDMEDIGTSGLSLHFYGWGRADLADTDYYDRNTDGELLYGYVEYSGKQARFNARLGRQYVFEGVSNESLDGLRLSSDLGRYFSGSVYAGQQVAMSRENSRSGDSIYGGRLANHLGGVYDLGLSYKKIRNDSSDAEEVSGIDLAAYLPYNINLHGFSSYNMVSDEWAEHSYELSASIAMVSIRPYFQQFQYNDYFGTGDNSSRLFRALAASGQELTIVGTDLSLPVGDSLLLVGKAKNYDYKRLYDTAQYLAAQLIFSGEGMSQLGGEFGTMLGDTAQNEYYLLRLFTYCDQLGESLPLDFISGDLVYVGYDQPINGEDSSLFLSLGTGKKFMDDALELKLSADYSSDPYFDKDLRGMLTASYNFSTSL
jgi:hypothetical protein